MPKFSSVVIENENEPNDNDRQACESSKDSMELTLVSKAFESEEVVGLSNISEVVSAFDNEFATVGLLDSSKEAQQISPMSTLPSTQEPTNLSKDLEDFTPVKRESPTEQANVEFDVPLKFLKKIKIEKE